MRKQNELDDFLDMLTTGTHVPREMLRVHVVKARGVGGSIKDNIEPFVVLKVGSDEDSHKMATTRRAPRTMTRASNLTTWDEEVELELPTGNGGKMLWFGGIMMVGK